MEMGNFTCIKICVSSATGFLRCYKSNLEGYLYSGIFGDMRIMQNVYSAKIFTFTVNKYIDIIDISIDIDISINIYI